MVGINRKKRFLGIDPGQSGGIAYIDEEITGVFPMPKTEKDIYDCINGIKESNITLLKCYIEKVHAMPKQGVSSTFKFGCGYGGLRMVLIALEIPFETVTPRAWQKALGVVVRGKTETKVEFKNRLKAKAQELFPHHKMTLAKSDALLIAYYASLQGV